MTEEVQVPTVRPRPRGPFAARSSRREYWISLAVILAAGWALSVALHARSTAGLAALTLFLQFRRAHDFGRTGWWAGLGQLAPAPFFFLPLPLDINMILAGLCTIIVAIVFGVIPGDIGENRFGPPPPTQLKAMFRRR
jgi:uncharacterized membrane protein YhaH (DUF805 family)